VSLMGVSTPLAVLHVLVVDNKECTSLTRHACVRGLLLSHRGRTVEALLLGDRERSPLRWDACKHGSRTLFSERWACV
jgi:hypothetical protein